MKKLTLNLDALTVDSFSTVGNDKRKDGTVFAFTDRYTDCWGLCGENTKDGGLMCGVNSETCTMNPADLYCISYAVECEPSMVPTNCPSEPTCYATTCRDSRTAC